MIDSPEQRLGALQFEIDQAYADGVEDAGLEIEDEIITGRLGKYRLPVLLVSYFKGRRERLAQEVLQ